jgi:hypothetical protein
MIIAEANTEQREDNALAEHTPLFEETEVKDMRERWQHIQGMFVDDPHASVEQAESLVASAIQRLTDIFTTEKSNMENAWSRAGGETSTEDMRQALRRYHAFFDRILTI